MSMTKSFIRWGGPGAIAGTLLFGLFLNYNQVSRPNAGDKPDSQTKQGPAKQGLAVVSYDIRTQFGLREDPYFREHVLRQITSGARKQGLSTDKDDFFFVTAQNGTKYMAGFRPVKKGDYKVYILEVPEGAKKEEAEARFQNIFKDQNYMDAITEPVFVMPEGKPDVGVAPRAESS